jgi:acetyl esterase/lipase
MTSPLVLTYAEHPTRKGPRALQANLFLPVTANPAPLVVWMHSGGFRSGSREHPVHARMAEAFAGHGYAIAFIDYRLARPPAILTPSVEDALPALIAEAEANGSEMHETFYGPRPLGVVEDCCAFLRLAADKARDWNLSGRFLLGGSSAGAISALNTLYLPARLGLTRPAVSTVLAFSGGYAYARPAASGARILALNNPADERVPIASIRRLAAACPDPCLLVESDAQDHGALTLDPSEPLAEAVARCVAFDQAADPLALDIG